MTEYQRDFEEFLILEKQKLIIKIVFMCLIWVCVANAMIVTVIQATRCPEMDIADLFWKLPETFVYNFHNCK